MPRNPGIRDGPWSSIDTKMVVSAMLQAEAAIKKPRVEDVGECRTPRMPTVAHAPALMPLTPACLCGKMQGGDTERSREERWLFCPGPYPHPLLLLLLLLLLAGYVLLGRPVAELAELAARFGQPAFRGQQLLDGVLKGARSVEDIPVVRSGCPPPPPPTHLVLAPSVCGL